MMNRSERHVCMLSEVPACTELPPTARLADKFMCGVRDLMAPCEWHHGAALYLRSARRLRVERGRGRARVHPYSYCAAYWQAAHMLLTIADYAYIPFQVFFIRPNLYDPFILVCDLVSFMNILVTLNTGYVDEDNKLIELEARAVATHYLRTTLFLDLLAALPLQLTRPFGNCQCDTAMYIFKLFGLVTLKREWCSLLEQVGLSYVKKQVCIVVSCVLLFFHWLTYLNYQVLVLSVQYGGGGGAGAKYQESVDGEQDSAFERYTGALFLVCSLCIGTGRLDGGHEHARAPPAELLLSSAMGVLGLGFIIYSFSILLRLAIYRQENVILFHSRLNELNEYMTFKRLPQFLQRKIQLFINYKFNGQFYNEESILSTINDQIKQDINMFSCRREAARVPLFQDLPVALINAIIFSLTKVLYMPGEVLVRYDEPGNSLFMIGSGTVAVMSASGRELAHLRDGSYFGETALIRPGTRRTATIIALEITETYRLDSREFQACLQPYPHLRRRLEDTYLKRRFSVLKQH